MPKHIAIIPDGNGRWAKLQKQDRTFGHMKGTANVKDIVMFAKELKIPVLTIYAFSDENWERPSQEVTILMELLETYLLQERQNLIQNKIQLRAMGDIGRLPKSVREELIQTMEMTAHLDEMILNFAISYGGRSEILSAIQKISKGIQKGDFRDEDITEALFSKFLYTHDLPDPDLLIRTSGELRISNFMLWQMAYTEIYVTDVLWPDFNREEFMKALHVFENRKRRFGKTQEQMDGS